MFSFNCFWIISLQPEIVSSHCQSAPFNKMLPMSQDRVYISCLVVYAVCCSTSLLFIYYLCYFNTQAFNCLLVGLVSLHLLTSKKSLFYPYIWLLLATLVTHQGFQCLHFSTEFSPVLYICWVDIYSCQNCFSQSLSSKIIY